MKTNKKNFLVLNYLVIFLFSCLFAFNVQAGSIPIGQKCNTGNNDECISNECEDSNYDIDKDDFCVCDDTDDCEKRYGKEPGEIWTCKNGTAKTHQLNFCTSNKNGTKFPVDNETLDAIKTGKTELDVAGGPAPNSTEVVPVTDYEAVVPELAVGIKGLPEFKSYKISTGETFSSPWLAQYIVAIYKYAVTLASIATVASMVVGGLMYMTSSGNQSMAGRGKSIIFGAITGLIIILGAHLLLQSINPNLTGLKSISTSTVEQEVLGAFDSATFEYTEVSSIASTQVKSILEGIQEPPWGDHPENFDCNNPPAPMGVIPEDQVQKATCPVGIKGSFTVIPLMKDPVCKAGEIADSMGYEIEIISSYRKFDKQVKLWCKEINKGADPKKLRSVVALPGFSNHGHGVALDVSLVKKGTDKQLTGGTSSKKQCAIPTLMAKTLAEIFYKADAGFVRLETEIWHFEYGTMGTSSRNWYNSLPESCTKKPSTISTNVAAPAPTPATGQSPAKTSNKCTFTEKRWDTNVGKSILFRKETNAPYDEVIASEPDYVSKVDSRCSICEQDQVVVKVGGGSTKMCWVYAEQASQILNKAVNSGLKIEKLTGYRPLRSGGEKDANGIYKGVGGHIYGMAIDINAKHNGLYNNCKSWDAINNPKGPLPSSCKLQAGGTWDPISKPTKSFYYGSPIYNAFTQAGWKWGGKDLGSGSQRDIMDFSIYGYDFSTSQ